MSLHWEHRVLATGPPGKSLGALFILTSLSFTRSQKFNRFCYYSTFYMKKNLRLREVM